MDKAVLRKAGHELRQIRDAAGLTLEDVQKATGARWGEDRILEATLSRIERGNISKPPSVYDLAQLALVYSLRPEKLLDLYGLPHLSGDPEHPIVTKLRVTLNAIKDDPEILAGLARWIEGDCGRAGQEYKAKHSED